MGRPLYERAALFLNQAYYLKRWTLLVATPDGELRYWVHVDRGDVSERFDKIGDFKYFDLSDQFR